MACCHADFALTDASDKAFTVGMPTFTFGHGCLGEAGDQARELGLRRAALFTDARMASTFWAATGPGFAPSRRSPSPATSNPVRQNLFRIIDPPLPALPDWGSGRPGSHVAGVLRPGILSAADPLPDLPRSPLAPSPFVRP